MKIWSESPEVKAALHLDKEGTEERVKKALRGLCEGWYHRQLSEGLVIFDKGRGWTANALLLRDVFPDSKILLCVRDLRDVFASIEKQHQKNPSFDNADGPLGKTVWERQSMMMSPNGIIGQHVLSILDVVRRRLDATHVIYENFVEKPKETMDQIYEYLGEEPFEHDFDNVKNTSEDVDAMWLNKFPHRGEGKVQPVKGTWKDVFTQDVANAIMERYPLYNKLFGYT